MYDTVLIPTDGSEHALTAAEHGAAFARAFDATVHLVAVVDVQAAAGMFDAGGVDEAYVARLEAAAERAIDAVAAVVGESVAVRRAVRRGEPSEAILSYADDTDVELLVMGTHGRTGVNRYIAGSVTERVVRLADVPVLTVRATEPPAATDYDEILLPTDGSEAAAAGVDHGLAIARRVGARVHAVSVVDAGETVGSPDYVLPADVMEHLESDAEAATDAVAERARAVGIDAVTAVQHGIPERDLLTYADDNDVDLIAMGTAGLTGLSRYLLGSTTERIIRHAEVPVLAVNARDRVES